MLKKLHRMKLRFQEAPKKKIENLSGQKLKEISERMKRYWAHRKSLNVQK